MRATGSHSARDSHRTGLHAIRRSSAHTADCCQSLAPRELSAGCGHARARLCEPPGVAKRSNGVAATGAHGQRGARAQGQRRKPPHTKTARSPAAPRRAALSEHSQKQRRRAGRAPARRSTLTPQRGPRAMDARAPRARKAAHRLVALPACLPACPRARTNKRHHHHPRSVRCSSACGMRGVHRSA